MFCLTDIYGDRFILADKKFYLEEIVSEKHDKPEPHYYVKMVDAKIQWEIDKKEFDRIWELYSTNKQQLLMETGA